MLAPVDSDLQTALFLQFEESIAARFKDTSKSPSSPKLQCPLGQDILRLLQEATEDPLSAAAPAASAESQVTAGDLISVATVQHQQGPHLSLLSHCSLERGAGPCDTPEKGLCEHPTIVSAGPQSFPLQGATIWLLTAAGQSHGARESSRMQAYHDRLFSLL